MTVSCLRIRNILKTYRKNLRWAESEMEDSEERARERDRVEISVEGRREQICQKAANHVVDRLTKAEKTKASSPEEDK